MRLFRFGARRDAKCCCSEVDEMVILMDMPAHHINVVSADNNDGYLFLIVLIKTRLYRIVINIEISTAQQQGQQQWHINRNHP